MEVLSFASAGKEIPMDRITVVRTGDEKAPSIVTKGCFSTPVWTQALWDEGPDCFYIHRNGCGHCCAAMALRLTGVDANPASEYAECLSLWGQPDEAAGQDHFQTVGGIVSILARHGIRAEAKGVADRSAAAADILSQLRGGGMVIFWSNPREGVFNPFSPFEHYVLAAGLTEDGRAVILNSGIIPGTDGVQLESMRTVEDALFEGATASLSGWGREDRLPECGGYVLIDVPNCV